MELEAETKVVEARSKSSRAGASSSDGMPRDRLIGRYELLHRLGHGGMATVYLGRAIGTAGFEKLVAVKVIHPHLANEPDFVEMFLDEARIAARIRHPHVVEILDLGREDDVFFMVMEYIEGDTLSTLLRELKKTGELLPVQAVLQMIADACEGLACAHDLVDPDGVPYHLVHRDVSPHNLLVGLDGRVSVVDFGIMKAAGKRSTTLTGQLRGKLPYMSPEQARGQPIDRRTDVFALGAVMWELLTNTRLISGETESEILAHVSDFQLPDINELRGDLPPAVHRVLQRALAADLERRYADAHEMIRDVRSALRAVETSEDPRRAISTVVKRHFEARIEYVRASARTRGIDRPADRGRHSSLLELGEAAARAASRSSSSTRTPTAVIDADGAPTSSAPLREFVEVPTQVTSTPAAMRPRSARSWTLMLGLPLVGAALGTAIVTYAQREKYQPAATAPNDPDVVANAGTTAADEPTVVKWVFNTEPQGARVIIDGRPLSRVTPVSVEMPRGAVPVSVRLEREGFEAYEAELAPLSDDNHSHRLVALVESAPEPLPKSKTNTSLTFSARKPIKKKTPQPPDAVGTATPPEPPSEDTGPKLADMPDLTGTKPKPPGR
jgi:serine/threonine protein kinase